MATAFGHPEAFSDDHYHGVVFIPRMQPGNSLQPTQWFTQNMAHTEVFAEHHNRRVGNETGIALLDFTQGMMDDLSTMRTELANFKEEQAKINAKTNAKTLCAWSVSNIQQLEDQKHRHVPAYKEDFGVYYRIPYQEAVKKIQPTQERVIRSFNVVCSVQELLVWQTPAAETPRTTIENKANTIIEVFLETENPDKFAPRLEDNGDLAEHYDEMDRKYRNFPTTGRTSTEGRG